ncbi:hypothetical protein L4G92_02700 [Neisseria sp. ZJ106]|uniref:Uncharacterized protein n=1 Tax=Neisseria lisongii TaxID=2912188 RepID=A0ABY7RHW7_9NEIS|nr:hypothetical protein [Neisseria lisongii]MCF7520963.1 hypothetical protein [Neisseria lisongii]WCL71234.1 hypothetical protein PJU73_07810 [Neisseria lisongii]
MQQYQMDLFSIISFALAIAAFILSIFMAWLSWDIYKKSTEAATQTQAAVTKIETAVLNIQSEITEIVRRAVGYWTGGDGVGENFTEQNIELTSKIEELLSQIQSLPGAGKQIAEDKLMEISRLQQEQVSALTASLVETKTKALVPSYKMQSSVAKVKQNISSRTDQEECGVLIIEVIGKTKITTATGKFTPPFSDIPKLDNVELATSPYKSEEQEKQLKVTQGCGKTTDFNVHINSNSGMLEPGFYIIRYTARLSE